MTLVAYGLGKRRIANNVIGLEGLAVPEGLLETCSKHVPRPRRARIARFARAQIGCRRFVEQGSVHRSRAAIKKGRTRRPFLMAVPEGFEPSIRLYNRITV